MLKQQIFTALLLTAALFVFSSVSFSQTENKIYPIDLKTEPVAAAFEKNKPQFWTSDESKVGTVEYEDYARFLSIEPSTSRYYDIILPGTNEVKKISGVELRKALAIYRVFALDIKGQKDKLSLLNEKTLAQYNLAIYGNEKGAQKDEDYEQAKQIVKEAFNSVKGYSDALKYLKR